MRFIFTCFFAVLLSNSFFGQIDLNTSILSKVDFNEGGSNIWGFVDSNGVEYAVIGTTKSTKILSLEDPIHPILRYEVFGSNTIWREIKYYKNHIYVATDNASDGLTIIDVSGAPDTFTHNYWIPSLTIEGSTATMTKHHSLFIDEENGIGYINGHNVANRGSVILDLKTNPKEPVYLGATNTFYCHDSYAKNNLLFSADLSNGFALYDVTDKANPIQLSRISTSSNFTHNAWISEDQNYVYTTDERSNAYIDVYDITDKSNPKLVDKFRTLDNEGLGVIPHNVHTLGKYAVTSYYTDGFIVTDMSRPDNVVLVARYDTYPGAHGGFHGCWGVYPYFPSGIIIASDIETGLWVVKPEYKRACYLEGGAFAKDENGILTPIDGAKISIIAPSQLAYDNTNALGSYKTGIVTPGEYQITFNHPSYGDQTATVTLKSGEVTLYDFIISVSTMKGNVIDKVSGAPISNAKILIENATTNGFIEKTTDNNGNYTVALSGGSTFNITATAWGYKPQLMSNVALGATPTFELEKGLVDDFTTDLGWTTAATASGGYWTRGIPKGTQINGNPSNPDKDAEGDMGNTAFVTGNSGTAAGDDDVDNGLVLLTSPKMQLSPYAKINITLSHWFVNDGGNTTPNDNLTISLSNGITAYMLGNITASTSAWVEKTYTVTVNDILFNDDMQIIVTAEDQNPGHVVEAGIDKFSVTTFLPNSTEDNLSNKVSIIPTISNQYYDIATDNEIEKLNIVDNHGKVLEKVTITQVSQKSCRIDAGTWPAGIYFITIETKEGRTTQKIVKM